MNIYRLLINHRTIINKKFRNNSYSEILEISDIKQNTQELYQYLSLYTQIYYDFTPFHSISHLVYTSL